MSKILLTTDIKQDKTAGLKARVDVSGILTREGYRLVEFPALTSIGVIVRFWKTLRNTVNKGDHIVVEYPCWMRRRLYLVKAFAWVSGVPFYGIIHDLNTIRFQTSPKREIIALKIFDALVSHNYAMTNWLQDNGYKKRIIDLNMFDYCLPDSIPTVGAQTSGSYALLYAGNLSFAKAAYIYDVKLSAFERFHMYVYGQYFEHDRATSAITYKGAFDPDKPLFDATYQFGLIWEGTSIETCTGVYGEYIRINDPHKFSLYISLGLPVIAWKEAAVARFITDHAIGFVVESMEEMNRLLAEMDAHRYQHYLKNAKDLSVKVRNGDFLRTAMQQLTRPVL